MRGNRFNFFVGAYALSLLILAVVGYYIYADHAQKNINTLGETGIFQTDIVYVDLPRVSVTLSSAQNGHDGSLRMDISLEIERKYAPFLEGRKPHISERLVTYGNRLDYDDLRRANATQHMREDILNEVNLASAPVPVKDIIFRQFLLL